MKTIKVYLVNGEKDEWNENEWSHYKLAEDMFIVIKNGAWIGFYPLRSVYKIVVANSNF